MKCSASKKKFVSQLILNKSVMFCKNLKAKKAIRACVIKYD